MQRAYAAPRPLALHLDDGGWSSGEETGAGLSSPPMSPRISSAPRSIHNSAPSPAAVKDSRSPPRKLFLDREEETLVDREVRSTIARSSEHETIAKLRLEVNLNYSDGTHRLVTFPPIRSYRLLVSYKSSSQLSSYRRRTCNCSAAFNPTRQSWQPWRLHAGQMLHLFYQSVT